jgi:aminomethyltransferase
VTETEASLLRETPFTAFHRAVGAKMVPFAGYLMPIQYQGMIAEHLNVRTNVGLFDLSHMGEFEVSGPNALAFLEQTTTNSVRSLAVGDIQYSAMCYENGGIVDDLLVYRLADRFFLVVNASNMAKDFAWLQSHLMDGVTLIDRSLELGLLAIQGPKAEAVMQRLTPYPLATMKNYSSAESTVAGHQMLFSRTGYTGEDGFELYIPNNRCEDIWKAVIAAGQQNDMQLTGLGARDSLRLEMKMALYGNDIDQTTTPIEAGLSWIVDFDKEFIGKPTIVVQRDAKPSRRLVCLEMDCKAIARQGAEIHTAGKKIGTVTSGAFSPSLQKPIALGYVAAEHSKIGTQLDMVIRGQSYPALVVKPPFYKHSSRKSS